MLTRYILHTDSFEYELTDEDLANWQDIQVSYKRSDYDGVVRSFSSEFEFVNEAKRLLWNLYLSEGVDAKAEITILGQNDRLEWDDIFTCPLDFSTLKVDSHILKLNAVDSSLAALISAGKSTSFEFEIGKDINSDVSLHYDRVALLNTVTHQLVSNINVEPDDGSIALGRTVTESLASVYVVGDPIVFEDNPVFFQDQPGGPTGHFLEIVRNVSDLKLEIELETDGEIFGGEDFKYAEIYLKGFSDTVAPFGVDTVFQYPETYWPRKYYGVFTSYEALVEAHPNPELNAVAYIGKNPIKGTAFENITEAYVSPVTNTGKTEWLPGKIKLSVTKSPATGHIIQRKAKCDTHYYRFVEDLSKYPPGTKFSLTYDFRITPLIEGSYVSQPYIQVKSNIKTTWLSRAKTISIDSISPQTALQAIVDRMCDGKLDVTAHIDDSDPRIANTYIFPSESIRGIPNAKYYSSFNNFCDWMSTVFGYVYYLGEKREAQYKESRPFKGSDIVIGEIEYGKTCPSGKFQGPFYDDGHFVVHSLVDGLYYTLWEGYDIYESSDFYNDPQTGKARTDTLFVSGGVPYLFNGESLEDFDYDANKAILDKQDIYFVHRDSLYSVPFEGRTKVIENATDISYSIDKSVIYSTVEIGYEKKDYEEQCGRDEWNFKTSYSTGLAIADKKLTLVSPYRSDCYGFEFLAQKRSQDNTDNKADKDVFFAHCRLIEDERINPDANDEEEVDILRYLVIERTDVVNGTLSSSVFNGEYSVYNCVMANACYIAAVGAPLVLRFASSDGNSDVTINGRPLSGDIRLDSNLYTLGQLEFTTDETSDFTDTGDLYEVTDSEGNTYSGFLLSVDLKYARAEAANFKLIVKDIK